ncbi:carboxynorspermidine decarboxylase [Desulfocurvibacter africanus PCS]|uniref:Carboxynorspermidine/carboxyspermidine decarboxylase n=1 Tax=Desulfocurvibacter africanus PCS TaxID=1262666 RepID=M5PQ59_DESAF|nr:carboxynorspermidine decarboxylase [Desulfocurvibacter africanus]EMG36115.1 carboxynorspermidine decarboxylase [Desulfocurvibacter africanus PCS]
MDRSLPQGLDLSRVPTPCFVVDERLIERNLAVLRSVIDRTDCRILLALKGFAMWSTFPLIARSLHGCTASSPHEARLAREEFARGTSEREVHAFAAGYSEADVRELSTLCDHIVFNSFNQWKRYRKIVQESGREVECGMRVNPEHSEGAVPIYDPCSPGSRMGVLRKDFEPAELDTPDGRIVGLHFHTLCEQNADALARTLPHVEEKFGEFFPRMKWLNFGGGHHISRPDYDVDLLVNEVNRIKQKYGLQVYLEPGEAIALDTGVLVATVLDVIDNQGKIAILDTSAAAHMPDVLEMPYRPRCVLDGENAGQTGEKAYDYRLAGHSCLAGDVIGAYSFERELQVGDKLAFMDMAIYSMVKTTTFNGLQLPSIAKITEEGEFRMVKRFGYEDFRGRLS